MHRTARTWRGGADARAALGAFVRRAGPGVRVAVTAVVALVAAGLAAGVFVPQVLVVAPAFGSGYAPRSDEVTVFAHRGGVRGHNVPDNSFRALRAAIERGYDGVELDVREAADGTLVAHHAPGFEGYHAASCALRGFHVCAGSDYARCAAEARVRGVPRCHVDDLTGEQIGLLRSDELGERVATFEALLEVVGEAGLELMLDFKEVLSPGAVDEVEELLRVHVPERPVYIIGRPDPKLTLTRRTDNAKFGVVRPAHPLAALLRRIGLGGEPFLFQNGVVTRAGDLVYSYRVGVELIPTLNWDHLGGRDPDREDLLIDTAHGELLRLYRLGVRTFQIDSEFDGVFFGDEAPEG